MSTWVFPSLPAEDAARELADEGVRYVEYAFRNLAMSSTDPRLRSDYASGLGAWALQQHSIPATRISEEVDSLGLRPVQMHAPQFDLADPDAQRRRLAVEKTVISLELCSALSVPVIVVHPGLGDNPGPEDDERVKRVRDDTAQSIVHLSARAMDLGVEVCIENAGHSYLGSTAQHLVDLVSSTDPEVVSTCVDTGHSIKNGIAPSDMIRELGPLVGATHLHDNDGASDQHLPPLCGRIGWTDVSRSIREIGYRRPLIAEIQGSDDLAVGRNRVALTTLALQSLFPG